MAKTLAKCIAISLVLALPGCGDGGSGGAAPTGSVLPPPAPPPPPPPPPPPSPPSGQSAGFATELSTSRFLTQATFGPQRADVSALTGSSAAQWFIDQLAIAPSYSLPVVQSYRASITDECASDFCDADRARNNFVFWRNAIEGQDQLRLRMAFALSQILVVSDRVEPMSDLPESVSYYQDILIKNAFGNYRDLLEEVTYAPAMGVYLTYMGNQAADPMTGRTPDENYARELLQLFTVGTIQLAADGEPVLGPDGLPVELYDNMDITGLARVFTGLDLAGLDRNDDPDVTALAGTPLAASFLEPMVIIPALHSPEEKRFLDCSIPAGIGPSQSIERALDCIMEHPNVGPFVSRQLIQRFTTSDPDPDYVRRVADAFETGRYNLPDGLQAGQGRKGDLAATLAAILFDPDAFEGSALSDVRFGKIREPLLRLTHWARAFNVDASRPEYADRIGYFTGDAGDLAQQAFNAPSVFNFYRPGYVAPGTRSGELGMTAPELQITDATTTSSYINFLTYQAFGAQTFWRDVDTEYRQDLLELGLRGPINLTAARHSFVADYNAELSLADQPDVLVDHLNDLLVYGQLSAASRASIASAVSGIALEDGEGPQSGRYRRVALAVVLVMSSPEYLVQR